MKRGIRVGIVGAGFGSRVLAPAFARDPRCRLTAIAASSLETAQAAAKELDISRAYGNWKDLVNDREIDVVVIAVPPDIQCKIAMAAIRSKKNIFCEKPVSVTAGDAKKIWDAAKRNKIIHAVDFEFMEIPAFLKARELIQSGKLGRLRHACLSWQVQTYANVKRLRSWKNDSSRGGGALHAFASHSFYYLEHILGRIKALNARIQVAPDLPPTQNTLCMMRLCFASGIYANTTISTHALHGSGHCLEIYGDRGALCLRNAAGDYIDGFHLFFGTIADKKLHSVRLRRLNSHRGIDGRIGAVSSLVSRFLSGVVRGESVQPGLEQGWRVQQLIQAAMRSSGLGGKAQWV